MPRTNVIIPFYQERAGILSVAVMSALEQGGDDLLVTVVDDGSPMSARAELASLVAQDSRVVIIEQSNAGPGAARNRGLDESPEDIEYIAFLDSDDRWLPGHLTNARAALQAGADFYFADADHHERGMGVSRFAECEFGASRGKPLGVGADLFLMDGSLFDAVLKSSPVGTSTVVFRRSMGSHHRFAAGLIFGEDKFLWMQLALAAPKVVFSTRCEAAYGRGVNIYAAATWGSPKALKRILHTAKIHRLIDKSFPLTAQQREWNKGWLAEVRRSFALNLLHLLHHRKFVDWRLVAAFLAMDPRLATEIISTFSQGLFRSERKSNVTK